MVAQWAMRLTELAKHLLAMNLIKVESPQWKLITHGSGSGSADYAPGQIMTFFKHKKLDMDPADWAKVLDGGVWGPCSEAYLLRRPEKGAEKGPRNP